MLGTGKEKNSRRRLKRMPHTHTPSFLSKQEGAALTKLMSLLLAICAPLGLAPPMALTRLILSVRSHRWECLHKNKRGPF